MHGPEVTWYVVLAAMLFVIGALGVLVRRSPLIILLSVEIMLNGSNLALIAFARHVGREDGQHHAHDRGDLLHAGEDRTPLRTTRQLFV